MTDQTPPAAQPQPAGPLSAAEDKQWAMWAHFGGILWILPSLIIFLVFKDRGALTKQESKEALNWQITFLIFYIGWTIIGAILTSVFLASGLWNLFWIPGLIGWLIYLANVVFSIMGGIKVNGGGSYRYPVNFRFIK
ncbi:MAG: DUF4870 domain-containing protein [Cryobacterium sp.]|nr:DUF4870 domain-containing protein [Cryobacterium sp.]MCO5294218.1 DUF4870 domain-containing protein [Homoserinimonas sp.]MCW5945173.1 DUF4870 domain-containing protein [Cryobacterium sp.]